MGEKILNELSTVQEPDLEEAQPWIPLWPFDLKLINHYHASKLFNEMAEK